MTAVSKEEIDALLAGDDGGIEFTDRIDQRNIRPFKFHSGPQFDAESLYPLQQINEALALRLVSELRPIFGRRVEVHARLAEGHAAATYTQQIAPGLLLMALTPDRDAMHLLLVLEPELVWIAGELFFGGGEHASTRQQSALSPVEDRLLMRLADVITRGIAAAWRDIHRCSFSVSRADGGNIDALANDRDDLCLVTRFVVTVGATREAAFDLIYPGSSLRQVLPSLAARTPAHNAARSDAPRPDWLRAIQHMDVGAYALFGSREISLAALADLQVGQEIFRSSHDGVELWVSGRMLGRGELGTCGDQRGVRIVQMTWEDPASYTTFDQGVME